MFEGLKNPRCRCCSKFCLNGAAADDRIGVLDEPCSAIARAGGDQTIVPARHALQRNLASAEQIGVVFVMDDRLDRFAVIRPCRGDPVLGIPGRRIGVAGRGVGNAAVEFQTVERSPAHRPVHVMQRENDELATRVAKRPARRHRAHHGRRSPVWAGTSPVQDRRNEAQKCGGRVCASAPNANSAAAAAIAMADVRRRTAYSAASAGATGASVRLGWRPSTCA